MLSGRSFSELVVGTHVLVVTCPVLGHELLRQRLKPDMYQALVAQLGNVLNGVQQNLHHGVQLGVVDEVGPNSPLGVGTLSVVMANNESYLQTGTVIGGVRADLDNDLLVQMIQAEDMGAMLMLQMADTAEMVKTFPWLPFIQLSSEELVIVLAMLDETVGATASVMMAAEDHDTNEEISEEADELFGKLQEQRQKPSPYNTLYLVLEDTAEMREEIAALWAGIRGRIETSVKEVKQHSVF